MTQRPSSIEATENIIRASAELRVLFDPPAMEAARGEFVPLEGSSLQPAIIEPLRRKYSAGLFTHQQQAIEQTLAGHHTVTATRTSSGKSMTFALPALDALCRDPNSTALFLYPQKALANDQLHALRELAASIEPTKSLLLANPDLVARYDGGVDAEDRKRIRAAVQMLATNPDMLHLGILQYHGTLWSRFFSNLKLVAIDECHDYRGSFGSHVAMVLRRLREVCRSHGADPVFTASSATIADPQAHLHRLTGLDFELVGPELDRSRQGRRKIWMVSGDAHHHDLGRRLAVQLTTAGLRTLVFCPSRVGAEKMLDRLRTSDGIPQEQMAVYRSGLSPSEREKIERGLKDGSIRLVFSTNALELGIDLGNLDVVVSVGLPSTAMSLWQRAGRVARGGREGAIVIIPGNSPMEAHYAQRPEEFFNRNHEPIAINIENEKIVCQHYACAIHENGGDEGAVDASVLGPKAEQVRERRELGEPCGDEFVCNDPHASVNIRVSGEQNYKLVCDGEQIGEIGTFHLLRETARNAIYRHGGKTYRVQAIIRGEGIVRLVRERTRNETIPYVRKTLALRRLVKQTDYPHLRVAVGQLEISEFLESLTEKDPAGNTIQTWPRPGGMPTSRLRTEGAMVVLKRSIFQQSADLRRCRERLAAESAERLLTGLFPTIAGPCDLQDYSSGILTTGEGDTAIVLYDTASGGIGLTDAAYRRVDELVNHAIDRVRSCDCQTDAGCIRCVAHPHQESDASKSAALGLLLAIKSQLDSGDGKTWVSDDIGTPGLTAEPQTIECPECNVSVRHDSRFCSNCGHKLETASNA